MDLGEILRLIVKRWYVAVPSLVIGCALPAAAYTSIPTKFQSESTLSMLNSTSASQLSPQLGNPFLSFDSSLTPTADALARLLSTSQAAQDLQAKGVTEESSAKLADNASGPFVTLTLIGTDKAHTLQSMQIFDDYAAGQLQALQLKGGNAPANSLIRSIVIVPPQDPVAQMKSKYEAVAGAGAAGMILAFLAVFGFDNVATRRGGKGSTGLAPASGGRSRRPVEPDEDFEDAAADEPVSAAPAPVASSEDGLRRRPSSGASDSSSGLRVRGRSASDSGDSGTAGNAAASGSAKTAPAPAAKSDFDFEAELGKSFEAGARSAAETQQLSLDAIRRAGGSEDLGWFPRLDEMDIDGLGDLAVADRESDKS